MQIEKEYLNGTIAYSFFIDQIIWECVMNARNLVEAASMATNRCNRVEGLGNIIISIKSINNVPKIQIDKRK